MKPFKYVEIAQKVMSDPSFYTECLQESFDALKAADGQKQTSAGNQSAICFDAENHGCLPNWLRGTGSLRVMYHSNPFTTDSK